MRKDNRMQRKSTLGRTLFQKGNNVNLWLDKRKNLILVLTKDGKKNKSEYIEQMKTLGSDFVLWNFLEEFFCNGWEWIHPEEIGALTDAPIISYDVTRDEDNNITEIGDVWAYADYMLFNPLEKLFENGSIVFMNSENL